MRNKLIEMISVLGCLFGCSGNNEGFQSLGADEFETALKDSSVVCLDVRTSDEFASARIGNAINIDVKKAGFEKITEQLAKSDNKIWIRPETTGKGTQWGDIDEVIEISKHFDTVLPCVDFAHLHARSNGLYSTYDEFSQVFEKIGNSLGQKALDNFHAHIAGINYTEKGERNHLNLEESDMNYKDLLRAMKNFHIKGALVCESPNIEFDTGLLKDFWESL